jgi:hypothetical protein
MRFPRKSKATSVSGMTPAETTILESLRDIEMSGKKTVNLNTTNAHCSELCESPKLAQVTTLDPEAAS